MRTLSRDIIDSRSRKSFMRVHTWLFYRPASPFRVNARQQFGDSAGIMSRIVYTKGMRGELACARARSGSWGWSQRRALNRTRHSVVFPPPLPPVILSPRGLVFVDEFLGVETMAHPTRIPSSRECVRADAARYSENVDDVSGRLGGRCALFRHFGVI